MPTLHRMTDSQLPGVLALLAESGSTARSFDSWTHDRMTALLLGDDSATPIAAMPIARRTITLSPGHPLNVGWLSSNQFATRMSLRRQTRDTAADWPGLLPELDALLVVRREEASLASRWYAQTGFHDVLAIRCLYLDMTTPPAPQAAARYHPEIVSPQIKPAMASPVLPPPVPPPAPVPLTWDPDRWQPQMLGVYQDVYAATGGAPVRHEHFWQKALANHYYRDHYQFQILGLWTDPVTQHSALSTQHSLMGYAVIGWSGWHSKRPRMDILELATRQWDAAAASELLHTTCQLAWKNDVHLVRAVISAHDPYRGLLTRLGFVDRWGYQMLAKWLHPQRHLDRLSQNLPPEIADLSVQLTTPGEPPLILAPHTKSGLAIETSPAADPIDTFMQGKIHAPSRAAHPALALHADPRTLTRLLLGRLDTTAAMHDGTLFATAPAPLTAPDQTRLSLAFPWTPWIFHLLDYI